MELVDTDVRFLKHVRGAGKPTLLVPPPKPIDVKIVQWIMNKGLFAVYLLTAFLGFTTGFLLAKVF